MIINAGITKVIYENDYPEKMGLKILEEAKIIVVRLNLSNSFLSCWIQDPKWDTTSYSFNKSKGYSSNCGNCINYLTCTKEVK